MAQKPSTSRTWRPGRRFGTPTLSIVLAILLLAGLALYATPPAHAAGTWDLTGSLTTTRGMHVAVLLQDGRVLVIGGRDAAGALNSWEVYDPATGQWAEYGPLWESTNVVHRHRPARRPRAGRRRFHRLHDPGELRALRPAYR